LYAWLQRDLKERSREENIKADMGMLKFEGEPPVRVVARPCGCELRGAQMEEVIKRYNQPHDVDVRANILCPTCKNRIVLLCE
jgi:hypothetical protein